MRITLQRKLAVILVLVACLGLATAVVTKYMIVQDFRSLAEGRLLDRVYQLQAVLENHYRHDGGWHRPRILHDLTWAALSGFEVRVYGTDNRLLASTDELAGETLKHMQKLGDHAQLPRPAPGAEWQDFPLFVADAQVGHLWLRFPSLPQERLFLKTADRFLAFAIVLVGGISLLISVFAARRLSRPLMELSLAVDALAEGRTIPLSIPDNRSDEIAQLGRRFNQMAARLVRQEDLRKQVVSNAAHELRTPLMILRGELEGMLDGVLPTTPDALLSLHQEAVRLAKLLDGVDELTRAQQADQTLQRVPTALTALIRGVMDRFDRVMQEQHIVSTVTADAAISVSLDPDRMTQVMTNLLSNAIKAMPQGGALDITVTTSHNSCQIDVCDTGCGIPVEILPSLFERFTKGFKGGLGLGLAITRELVQAHGGTIHAQNRTTGGSCFTIMLPRD